MFTSTAFSKFKAIAVFLLLLSSWRISMGVDNGAALRVVVSTPDVMSITRMLGGDLVEVSSITNGPDDPHIVNLRASHVLQMQNADLFIMVGNGIEDAWLEDLIARVSNPSVNPGNNGHLDLSSGIRPLPESDSNPEEQVTGSFHEEGNPHYLLDPVEGLKAARAVSGKLQQLLPPHRDELQRLYSQFVADWAVLFFGPELGGTIGSEDLENSADGDAIEKTIAEIIAGSGLNPDSGLAGAMVPFRNTPIVGDHDLWPYFARRFHLVVLGYLEPSPGIPPTTRHLSGIITQMKTENVGVILTAPYFDQRHVRFVSERTGARIVPMSHQTGGRHNTAGYFEMLQYNVDQLTEALRNHNGSQKSGK
jgi:ABC-type Zn uptake system ZnuABC Zn-binding protein ZnuA